MRDKQRWIYIGVDLGKRRDFTAIAVVERVWEQYSGAEFIRTGIDGKWWFRVRMLERLSLQTEFPDVVERVNQIAGHWLVALSRSVVVDGTGLGNPVVDLLRRKLACQIMPIIITGGDKPNSGLSDGYESVPRSILLTNMQVLAQQGRLQVSGRCKEAGALRKEMLGLKLNGPGSEPHDDLAFAVALALWKAKAGIVIQDERR